MTTRPKHNHLAAFHYKGVRSIFCEDWQESLRQVVDKATRVNADGTFGTTLQPIKSGFRRVVKR